MPDLCDAMRCVSEAEDQLRSMVNQHRPTNTRNINAVRRWLERALNDLEGNQ